jgi:FtsP/CotA-like multicopper oxidase with cupredoxin domain
MGQALTARATRVGDTVTVTVSNTHQFATWQVVRVGDAVGATITATTVPPVNSRDSLVVRLRLDAGATQATFTVEAQMSAFQNERCAVRRVFTVTPQAGGVTVAQLNLDSLPLSARQRAEIVVVAREGNRVALVARTPWRGPRVITWEVSAGVLDTNDAEQVWWTLPGASGIYQAEVAIDFDEAGLAFDVLALEVL